MSLSPPLHAARRLALASGVLLLAGCASLQSSQSFLSRITPYRLEIVQGNVVTKEQAAQVKPGMTRAQVRDLLGSPLLTDPFHADRWDYVFSIQRRGTEPQLRSVVALFEGQTLKSLETSGDLPSEREFIASIDPESAPHEVPSLALTEEQRKALPAPPRPTPAQAVPDVAARTYPPLETTRP